MGWESFPHIFPPFIPTPRGILPAIESVPAVPHLPSLGAARRTVSADEWPLTYLTRYSNTDSPTGLHVFNFYKNNFIRASRLKFCVKSFQKLRRRIWENMNQILRTSEARPEFTGSYKNEGRFTPVFWRLRDQKQWVVCWRLLLQLSTTSLQGLSAAVVGVASSVGVIWGQGR